MTGSKGGLLDYNKIKKYLKVLFVVRRTLDKNVTLFQSHYRHCKTSDFKDRKLEIDEQSMDDQKNRLCPDFDGFSKEKELFKLKNGYNNVTERYSFSTEVHLQNNESDKNWTRKL